VLLEILGQLKIPMTANQTRDIPACSIVPQIILTFNNSNTFLLNYFILHGTFIF
jgi:hypothetical protein